MHIVVGLKNGRYFVIRRDDDREWRRVYCRNLAQASAIAKRMAAAHGNCAIIDRTLDRAPG
jgi:hypothetical protein